MVRRPFHEVLPELLLGASNDELDILVELIQQVKIPKNHDEIIAAFNDRTAKIMLDEGGFGWDVVADLLLQKQEAEEEARAKQAQENSSGID